MVGFAQTQTGDISFCSSMLLFPITHTIFFSKLQKKQMMLEYLNEKFSYFISVFVGFGFSVAHSFNYVP